MLYTCKATSVKLLVKRSTIIGDKDKIYGKLLKPQSWYILSQADFDHRMILLAVKKTIQVWHILIYIIRLVIL